MNHIAGLAITVFVLQALATSAFAGENAPVGKAPTVLEIAGISATTGEDEPRILFILPLAAAEPATPAPGRT